MDDPPLFPPDFFARIRIRPFRNFFYEPLADGFMTSRNSNGKGFLLLLLAFSTSLTYRQLSDLFVKVLRCCEIVFFILLQRKYVPFFPFLFGDLFVSLVHANIGLTLLLPFLPSQSSLKVLFTKRLIQLPLVFFSLQVRGHRKMAPPPLPALTSLFLMSWLDGKETPMTSSSLAP